MERILAVEDKLDMLFLIKTIIEGYSEHQIINHQQPDGSNGIAGKERFDLTVTDLKMPGLNRELLELAKKTDEDMLVIMVTAFGSPDPPKRRSRKAPLINQQAFPEGTAPPGSRQGHAVTGE